MRAEDTLSAAAAPIAWNARTISRKGRLLAKKHRIVATVKISCPSWYIFLRPMRSPRPANGSSSMTKVSW
jgi:hypothetical protein